MSDGRINWLGNLCDYFGVNGGRVKNIDETFFWKSMLKIDGESKVLYFYGNVDADYIGRP